MILAAIGTMESDNGQSNLPGVHSGANAAGAEGIMQFEPATFVAYDEPVPPGGADPPSPYDPTDAVYAAAAPPLRRRRRGRGRSVGRRVRLQPLGVLRGAGAGAGPVLRGDGAPGPTTETPGSDDRARVRWRSRGPCPRSARRTSGVARHRVSASTARDLVQAAYAVAGVALPRVRAGPVRRHAEAGPGRGAGARAIWSSSGVGRPPSTTSGCSSAS